MYDFLSRISLPAKNKLFPSFTKTFRRPSLNSLSAASCSLPFAALPPAGPYTPPYWLITAGSTKGVHPWKKDEKLILLFFTSFFHGCMLRICPQYNMFVTGGVLVPLRGGSSENVLSKGREHDGRHLRQRSGGVFVNKGSNNFWAVIQGQVSYDLLSDCPK